MTEMDLAQLAVLGFATGLGTTFGGEFAKAVFSKLQGWLGKRAKVTES